MPKFVVEVFELHKQEVFVTARNARQAKLKVADGEGDYRAETMFISTLDYSTWNVRKEQESDDSVQHCFGGIGAEGAESVPEKQGGERSPEIDEQQ